MDPDIAADIVSQKLLVCPVGAIRSVPYEGYNRKFGILSNCAMKDQLPFLDSRTQGRGTYFVFAGIDHDWSVFAQRR